MTSTSAPVLLVLGAGPGLGMSVAHRSGKEGYAVALISRSADRHGGYLQALTDAGVDAAAFTGDAIEPHTCATPSRRPAPASAGSTSATTARRAEQCPPDAATRRSRTGQRRTAQLRDHAERGAATGGHRCRHHRDRRPHRRGDIHQAMQANPNSFGDLTGATLNPDQLAETVWRLYTERTKAEAVINALAA